MNDKILSKSQEKKVTKNDEKISADFLLAEYERLRDLRSEIGQRASRRFEFYLTFTSAIIGAFLLLTEIQDKVTTPQYIIDLTASGLLIYGIITYINLSFSSAFQIQIIRAFKEIQKYFIEHDPSIAQYLYFNSPPTLKSSYHFLGILGRGLGGGSEKTLIALINSTIVTYLTYSLIRNVITNLSNTQTVIIGIVLFLTSGFIHAIYLTLNYRFARSGVW